MNIREHQEIITKWIESCKTSEQLDLLVEVINEFVVKRFKDHADQFELEVVKTELVEALTTQKMKTLVPINSPIASMKMIM